MVDSCRCIHIRCGSPPSKARRQLHQPIEKSLNWKFINAYIGPLGQQHACRWTHKSFRFLLLSRFIGFCLSQVVKLSGSLKPYFIIIVASCWMNYGRPINRLQFTSEFLVDPNFRGISIGEIICWTYKSYVKPQYEFLGLLSHACFIAGSATCCIIAALINDVFSWRVYFGCLLWHLDYFLVSPSTHSLDFRPHHVLPYVVIDVWKFKYLMKCSVLDFISPWPFLFWLFISLWKLFRTSTTVPSVFILKSVSDSPSAGWFWLSECYEKKSGTKSAKFF